MYLAYTVKLEKDDNDTLLVTSKDFPELTTFGKTRDDALRRAAGAIAGMIESYMERGLDIPVPKGNPRSRNLVTLPTLLAAKVALYTAMRDQKVTQAELARRLKTSDRQIRRLLDPANSTRFEEIDAAFAALGLRAVLEVAKAA